MDISRFPGLFTGLVFPFSLLFIGTKSVLLCGPGVLISADGRGERPNNKSFSPSTK